MKNLFISIFVIFILTGCNTFYKAIVGVSTPKANLNDTELIEYAKAKYPAYKFARVSQDFFPTLLKDKYKPDWEPGFRPVQFLCFDKKGQLITQWASCEGELNKFVLTDTIPRSKYKSFRDITFKKLCSNFRNEDGYRINTSLYDSNDFIYVVYWTMWTDRQSRNLIKSLEEYISKSRNKSALVLVNADYYTISND